MWTRRLRPLRSFLSSHRGWLRLFALGLALGVEAQPAAESVPAERDFLVRVWRKEHGLPEGQVLSLLPTRDGFLWIGTRRGLARCDGFSFKVWSRSTDPWLDDDSCTALTQDSQHHLWVGTTSKLIQLGAVGAPAVDSLADRSPHPGSRIRCLLTTSSGQVYAGTEQGAYMWRSNAPWRSLWEHNPRAAGFVTAMAEGPGGSVWFGSVNQLWRWDPAENVLHPEFAPDRPRTEQFIHGLVSSPAGTVFTLIGNELTGTGRVLRHRNGSWTELGPELAGAATRPLFLDSSGALWFRAVQGGLIRWIEGKATTYSLRNSVGDPPILCFAEDAECNLWIGTQNGLACLQPRRIHSLTVADGLPHDNIWTLLEAADGALWVGTDGGVARLKDGSSFTLAATNGLACDRVRALAQDSQGSLWIGTAAGLSVLEGESLRPLVIPGEWFRSKIRALLATRDGAIWIGAAQGLHRIKDGQTNSWFIADGLPHDDICALMEDRRGRLWVGTDGGGAVRFDGAGFTRFGQAEGLASERAWTFLEDGDGRVWVGTDRGLCCIQAGTVRVLTTTNGLPDNLVNCLVDDGNGSMWIGHDAGIYHVRHADLVEAIQATRPTLHCVSYGEEDGLLRLETNGQKSQPSALRLRDGRIGFATPAGVALFDPRQLPDLTNGPQAHIERVTAGGTPLDLRPKGAPATGDAPPRVTVPSHLQRQVEVQFTAPCLRSSERTAFRYRLLGTDSVWVRAPAGRRATYAYLHPGEYTFEVAAANAHGYWSAEPARVRLHVEARLIERTSFRLGAIVALVAIVFFLARWRLRELGRMHHLEAAAAVEQERGRLARDLHDGLGASLIEINLISRAVARTTQGAASSDQQLETLHERATEALRSMRELIWTTNPSADTLQALVSRIADQTQQLLQAAGIRCRLDLPNDFPDIALGPHYRRSVLLACLEAVNNAVRHAAATTVILRVAFEDSRLVVEVRDDGVGFDPPPLTAMPPPGGGGLGLKSMVERVESHAGSCRIWSGPGKGTVVTFHVPIPSSGPARR